MGLLDDLKKKAMGAIAQVNPLDGGKTYASYNPAPVAPVQQSVQTAKYGVLANNPQAQQRLTNDIRPVNFSAVGAARQTVTEIGKGIAKPFQQTGNMAVYGGKAVNSLVDIAQKQKTSAQATADLDRYSRSGGTFGAGLPKSFQGVDRGSQGFIQDPAKIRSAIGTGSEIGSTLVPVGKGLSVAKQGTKVIPKLAAQSAPVAAVGSAGSQYGETGKINPTQLVQDTAIGTALGIAPPALYAGAKKGLSKVTVTPQITPTNLTARNDLLAKRAIAEIQKPSVIPMIDKQIAQIDATTKPRLNLPFKPVGQGGYVKNPMGAVGRNVLPETQVAEKFGVKGNSYTTYHPQDIFENDKVFKTYKPTEADSRYLEDISQQALPADSSISYAKIMPTKLLTGTEGVDQAKVSAMVKAIKNGQELPPIIVENTPFTKNGQKLGYTVFDGNNRLEAYKQAGVKEVKTAVITNAEDFTNPRIQSQKKPLFKPLNQGGGYNGGKKSKNFDTAPNTPQENPIETTKYQSGSKELADTLNTDLSGKNITIDTDAGPVSGKVVKNNPSRVTTSEQTWSIGGITQKETLYSNNDSSIILEQPDGSRTAIKGRMVNGLQVEGTPVQNPLGGTPKKSAKQVDMEKRYYQSQLNTLSPNTIGYKEAVAKLNELENAPAQNPLGKEGAPIEKTPNYMKDKVTPEGYFTEGRYKDSAYPKSFVAKTDIPDTNIKAGDKVALVKDRNGNFTAILDKPYEDGGFYVRREHNIDPNQFSTSGAPIEKPTLSPKNQAESVVTDPNQLKTSQPLEQGPQTGTLKSPLGNPLDTIIPQESIQTPQQGIKNAKETAQGKAPQGATAKLVESVRAQGSTSEDIIQAIDPTRTVKTNQETWTNAGQKLYELGDDGALNYFHENHGADANAVAWRLYEKRLANGDKQGAQTLLADMTTRSIENGQAAQAWAMIKRLDPKFIVQKLDRQVNTFVNANPKLNGRIDWSADKQAKIMQFAEGMANDKLITKLIKANDINSIAKLTGITDSKILKGLAGAKDPERVKMLLNANLNKEINSILPSKFGDKAMAYWKSGLLSAPVTHVRNIIGNTVNAAFGAIETPLAGGFDATVGRALTPTKRTVSANPLRGALTGAKMGAQDFSDALKYGLTKDDTGKFNYKSINWNMNNPVERYVFKPFTDTIFRTLGAEDKLFKQPAIVTSLYNMADAAAISAGKRGDVAWMNEWVKNAPAAVLDQAKAEGGIAVFQKDTVVSTGMQGLRQAIKRKHPGYEKIVEAIQPFVNVPAAIGSELLTYTPAGLLRVGNKARKALDKNLDLTTRDVYRRQAMKDLSKTTVGGGLIMAGLAMGYNGDATGAAPTKGTKEYEQWVLENKQPNSIKIGGKWFNINSVGPQLSLFNAAAQTGASMRQDAQKGKTTGFADNAITLTGNIGKNFMDSSSLTGATDASNALKDPKRYARNYAARQATSFIPNIAKRAGSGFDPYQRETSSFKDAVQAQIPVARNDLPARVDSLGNPVKNNAYGGYGLKALFDPFNTSTAKTSPVIDELSKLSKSGQNATPTGIDANTTISGVKVSLTPNQHNEINTLVGKATNDGFGTFMNTPEYKAMNDEQRKKVLESYQNDISTAKKQQFAADNGIGPYANGAENSKPLNVREQKVLEGTSTITDYMPKQSKTKVRGVAKTSTKKVSVKRASTKKVKLAKIKIPKSPKIKVGKMKSARMIKVGVKSRSKVKIRTKV